MNYIKDHFSRAQQLDTADHIDVKTVASKKNLLEFADAFISYEPGWLKFLYRIRGVMVVFLGLKQDEIPEPAHLPSLIEPPAPGAQISFWTVVDAQKDSHLVLEAKDKHLAARLIIAAEPLADGFICYHLATAVFYRNWAGPVYFNLIRPFHHLVVHSLARAAAR